MNKNMARGLHQLVSGEGGQPVSSVPPSAPNACYRIVHARWFQRLIIAVILLAGAIIGVETSPGVSPHVLHLLHVLDRVVLGIFVVEMEIGRASCRERV